MAIFNSYISLPEGINNEKNWWVLGDQIVTHTSSGSDLSSVKLATPQFTTETIRNTTPITAGPSVCIYIYLTRCFSIALEDLDGGYRLQVKPSSAQIPQFSLPMANQLFLFSKCWYLTYTEHAAGRCMIGPVRCLQSAEEGLQHRQTLPQQEHSTVWLTGCILSR